MARTSRRYHGRFASSRDRVDTTGRFRSLSTVSADLTPSVDDV
jgi:hypothetical protein